MGDYPKVEMLTGLEVLDWSTHRPMHSATVTNTARSRRGFARFARQGHTAVATLDGGAAICGSFASAPPARVPARCTRSRLPATRAKPRLPNQRVAADQITGAAAQAGLWASASA
jgi:hypothetical protein